MRPRTPKRAAQERKYLRRAEQWLEGQWCARCGTTRNLTVQHLRGRRGDLLLAEEFWLALCWPCHSWAELNPVDAKEQGFAQNKVGAA